MSVVDGGHLACGTVPDCGRLVAGGYAQQDPERADKFYAEAIELADRLPDGELLAALIAMDRVTMVDLALSRNQRALEEFSRLLAFHQERGLELHQSAVHNRLATTLLREELPGLGIGHLTRSLAGYVEQGNRSWTAHLHEVISTVPGRPVGDRIRDLATAAQLRYAGDECSSASITLRELAVLLPEARRGSLLRAALVLADAQGQHLHVAAVLDDLAAVTASRAERAELERQAAAARRRGEPLHVLVGSGLGNLLDPDHGGALLAELETHRAELAPAGITLPFVRTIDDSSLPSHSYRVYLWGEEVGRGAFDVPRLLPL